MRKMLLATAIVAMPMLAQAQYAQGTTPADGLPPPVMATPDQVVLYLKRLPPDVWLRVMRSTVKVTGLSDTPGIAVFNTAIDAVERIRCDAPIPGRSVVIEHANSWDGYCKNEIVGQTDDGNVVGTLDVPGDFTGSTNIIMREKR
jgi:hypothetical protein